MTTAPVGPPEPPVVGPIPSAWVNFAALQLDPGFDCHNFEEVTKLYSMPTAYAGLAMDIGCRLPGNYIIDFRTRVSRATKNSEYSVSLQMTYQNKPFGYYMGGWHAENVSVWINRLANNTAESELRRQVGPICGFLDTQRAWISFAAMGDLELNPLFSLQPPAAYQVYRTEQQVNQVRVAMLMIMREMGWHVKVEAFCPIGYIASGYGSISTDDVRDIPPSYDPRIHDVLVTGTPDAAKIRERLTAGRTHYIDSAHFVAGQPLPGWWPSPSNPGGPA